jgi:hypothetical protein
MSDVKIPEALVEAAARGVQVTIITNSHPEPPPLRFKWQHSVHRDCAISTFKGAGFEIRVVDQDGDASYWTMKRGKALISEGESWDWEPYYHFDACRMAAEQALIDAARSRAQAIRSSHD